MTRSLGSGLTSRFALFGLVAIFSMTLAACGSSGSDSSSGSEPTEDPGPTDPGPTDPGPTDPGPTDPGPTDPGPTDPAPAECEGVQFDSTFDAVQQVVFDGYGCTNSGCHGDGATSGGLDLSAGAAWGSLHDVPSAISADRRIVPGAAARSVLYQKLAAATLGEDTPGSPMPIGLPALSENDLNLVRWWIYGGAPEDGVVLDAAPFVPGCLPDPEPLEIKPLDPPAPGEGFQIEMPVFDLEPGLEVERCFASYFDACDQVPEDIRTTFGNIDGAFIDGRELRMDPGSHHLILNYAFISNDELDDPSFGDWVCAGGDTQGASCEPTDLTACGEGYCRSRIREGFGCFGYGPTAPGRPVSFIPIGGAQRAQDFRAYPEGVFNPFPCRGVLYWNPHAFNLTTATQTTHARLNYYFADPDQLIYQNDAALRGVDRIFIANNAPFTKETYCNEFTFPQGARVHMLSSHTHKHGEHFWINDTDDTLLYENYIYNDPSEVIFDPPLEYDSPDPAERTITYCATYNNGVRDDGSPDVDLVTRASRVPQSARVPGSFGTCSPVACVNDGMIGEPCDGEDDNASCDSSPGAGDGFCDACNITGGESTENEMFLLIAEFYVVPVE